MPTSSLLQAGQDLADFARAIAAETRQASGDVMDGAYSEALADAWDEARAAGGHQEAAEIDNLTDDEDSAQ